jgi:hypothetical protein
MVRPCVAEVFIDLSVLRQRIRRSASIEADDVKRILADIDNHRALAGIDLLDIRSTAGPFH